MAGISISLVHEDHWNPACIYIYIYIYIYVHYIKTNINRCIQTKIWVLSITCHDVIVWYRIQDGTYQQGFRHGILSHALLSSSHRWLNSEVYKLLLTSNTSKILPYINRLSILRWLGFPLFPTLGAFFLVQNQQFRSVSCGDIIRGIPSLAFQPLSPRLEKVVDAVRPACDDHWSWSEQRRGVIQSTQCMGCIPTEG